jgi:hypothetical protein
MTLAGDIADFDLAEIIQLIGRQRKTGRLLISGSRNYVTLYFKEGQAVFASPAHQSDYIGNILVRRGVVSRADVETALAAQRKLKKKGQNVRIGSILAAKGAISKDLLRKYIRLQIEETVMAAMSERAGRFEFVTELDLDDGDIIISVNPEWIVLESSRQLDEWGEIGSAAPPPDAVFAINPEPSGADSVKLGLTDWRIVSLINGVRTVEEVINESGLARVSALRTVSQLVETGIIVANNNGDPQQRNWELAAGAFSPPPADKGLIGRIISKLRGI